VVAEAQGQLPCATHHAGGEIDELLHHHAQPPALGQKRALPKDRLSHERNLSVRQQQELPLVLSAEPQRGRPLLTRSIQTATAAPEK
jgi:hypothetical protein